MSYTLPSINARYFQRKPNTVVSAQISPCHLIKCYTNTINQQNLCATFRTSRAEWRILQVLHSRAAKCGLAVGRRGCLSPQLLHLCDTDK